jgi:hypothetical protein
MRFQVGNAALERRRWADMLFVALVDGDLPVEPIGHSPLRGFFAYEL